MVFKKHWHKRCLVCTTCEKPFDGGSIYNANGQPYCEQHYLALIGTCDRCDKPFLSGYITLGEEKLHKECVVRVGCGTARHSCNSRSRVLQ